MRYAMAEHTHTVESTLADELREQVRRAPALAISIMLHLFLFCIFFLLPLPPPPEQRTHIIINGKFEVPEPEKPEEKVEPPLDIPEMMPDTDLVQTTAVNTQLTAMTNEVSPTVETSVSVEMPQDIDVPIPDMALPDMLANDSSESMSDAADGGEPLLGVATNTYGANGGLSSGNRGGMGQVGKSLRRLVGGGGGSGSGGGSKGLCLVWLLDQSKSMKDDQEAVSKQAEDIQELLTDGNRKSFLSAVVSYADRPMLLQKLTSEGNRISDTIANVPPAHGGTENVCRAIAYTCQEVMEKRHGWTKVIVLLTDENGDDHKGFVPEEILGKKEQMTWQDYAVKEMKDSQTRLFVIGKESPFQASSAVEYGTNAAGGKIWMNATRGPESAFIEVPISNTTYNYDHQSDRNLSGFGAWDLAYLAKESKGAYFILDDSPEGRKPLSASERARDVFRIDWGIMDEYKPLMVNRAKYADVVGQTSYGRALLKLRKMMANLPGRHYQGVRPPSHHAGVERSLKARLDILNDAIALCTKSIPSDEVLSESEHKRDVANLDLYLCVLYADKIITESVYDAYHRYKGPTPDDNTVQLSLIRPQGAELTPEKRATYDQNVALLNDAINEVIRRHANTPWASIANICRNGPRAYAYPFDLRLDPYIPAKPTPKKETHAIKHEDG